MTKDSYDLVLYGATGFTGRQAARQLAAHRDRKRFRFAIGGRDRDKLEALAGEVAPEGVVVADALDAVAIDRMVAATRVVASTTGPYARYGNELVRACVEQGVDYVDITGETPWIRSLVDRHHDQARDNGARIVPCCGYDSVPSDLGAWIAVERLRETAAGKDDDPDSRCVEVRAFHRGRGGINGGTVASLLNLQREGRAKELADPFLLDPPETRSENRSAEEVRRNRDPVLPFYDSEIRAWAAPFFMGAINTRVVRRSAALLELAGEGYGPGFRYQEYWKATGLFGGLEAGALATAQSAAALFASGPGASWIGLLAPKPGEGPSERTMDRGFFETELLARAESGRVVRLRLAGRGDPGNRITVTCLCESALALVLDGDDLPTTFDGGLLTPATALGPVLEGRLRRTGIEIQKG